MTDTLVARDPAAALNPAVGVGVVDCDIHTGVATPNDLDPYLPRRWRDHAATIGIHVREGVLGQEPHPRMTARGMRADAMPPVGPPGSSLALLQRQHLDPNGVAYGMMIALGKGGMEERNQDFAAATAHALNSWQIDNWVEKDKRLVAGVIAPQEDAVFAVSEIEERAEDRRFRQILLSPKSQEPLGRRRYWPIYAAAESAGLPIALHPAAVGGGHSGSAAGWPTFYVEEHNTFGTIMQGVLTSLVFEGVFERFPKLKVVMVEGGFTWVPTLAWRMDAHWAKMRSELPHVKRPPSEYIREQVWYTTQPMEEPTTPAHLRDIIDWIGWDRLMFSSDYPHWDFDDPAHAFKIALSQAEKRMVFADNARALYGLA